MGKGKRLLLGGGVRRGYHLELREGEAQAGGAGVDLVDGGAGRLEPGEWAAMVSQSKRPSVCCE